MKTYQVVIRLTPTIVRIKANDIQEAKETAMEKFMHDIDTNNSSLEFELEQEIICSGCGISLQEADIEFNDSMCLQCDNKRQIKI